MFKIYKSCTYLPLVLKAALRSKYTYTTHIFFQILIIVEKYWLGRVCSICLMLCRSLVSREDYNKVLFVFIIPSVELCSQL